MGITITPMTREIAELAAALRARHERLPLPDAIVIATSKQLSAQLLSYDPRLVKIASA